MERSEEAGLLNKDSSTDVVKPGTEHVPEQGLACCMWQPLAALCKKPSNAYPLCLLPNYGTTIEQTVTLAWQYIHVCHFLLGKHVLSLPKNTSSFGSRVTDLVLLIIFLLQLSEAEPDRQVDSGMLKRVNPGHLVTLIS